MPLDNTMNIDVHTSLCTYCVVIAYLPDGDPAKFSMQNPLTIASAISRVYCPTTGNLPSGKRIVEDFNKALRAIGVIQKRRAYGS